jgi:hypothetical protein
LSLHGPRTVAELLQIWFDLRAPETMGDAALSQADWAIRVHPTPTLGRYRVTDLHAERAGHVLRAKAGDLGSR